MPLPSAPSPADQPRWRRRPSERPEEILEAALRVFADRGLAGARMDDIAAEAGISKGTLYLYFSGKDELFREAIREKLARLLEGLASAAPPGEPVQRLERFIRAYFGHLDRPQFANLYRLILAELRTCPELVRFWADEVSGRVMGLLTDIVREGVESGDFRAAVPPPVTARMIVGLLVQHAVWSSRRELFPYLGDRSADDLVDEVVAFVSAALMDPTGPAREVAS
jgi:AcrR family transcriptional regulator